MKTIRFMSLMFVIWAVAVFVKVAPIKEIFRENPFFALAIAIAAMLVYGIMMEE